MPGPSRPSRRARPRLLLVAALALGALGCGGPEEAPTPAPPATAEATSAGAPAVRAPGTSPERAAPGPNAAASGAEAPPGEAPDPAALAAALAGLGAPDEADPLAAAAPPAFVEAAAPPSSCALLAAPQRVIEGAEGSRVVADADTFLVAAYARDAAGEAVVVVRARPGRPPDLVTRLALEAPAPPGARRGGPGLALDPARRLTLAALDGRGRLLVATLDAAAPATRAALTVVAEDAHADLRFPPAVVVTADARVLAWTSASATPMRVRLARLDASGALLGTHDVTPAAGGAAAPVAGRGEGAPTLYTIDPRAAISVVHRVTLGDDGAPGIPSVVRPLNLTAEVPAFAVVRGLAEAPRWLAYAAVGNGATRAVGLVRAEGDERPAPLVAGLGYGAPLSLDAEVLATSVLVAAEAPSAAAPTAPHEVRLRVVAADGSLGEALVLAGERGPTLARGERDVVAVATEGGRIAYVRCAGPEAGGEPGGEGRP